MSIGHSLSMILSMYVMPYSATTSNGTSTDTSL